MTELERLCENALYDEIRVMEDGKSVVRDIPTGKLYFKKTLDVYNEHVYAYLRDHKNRHVAAVQAFWKEGENLVVIEELIQGKTLDELLVEGGMDGNPLSFSERIDYLAQICDGLQFLHSAEPPIIHRDIKASNIMVTDDGIVKIIDYDAAKIYVTGQEKDTMMIGTQGLAAPEQYGFAQSDVRTDLYALGKLIERMLPDNIDAGSIAAKATEMDPKKRYSSAEQMKGQILRIREQASALDRKLEKIPGFDPMNKSHRIRARVGLAVISAAAAVLMVFLYWRLVIFPARMQEQISSQLTAITEMDASNDGVLSSVTQFAQNNPYSRMTAAQKKTVRDAMEATMERCLSKGKAQNAAEIRDILIRIYGEQAVWEAVYGYAEADHNVEKGQYGEALEELRKLREEGADGAQEHWDAATGKALESAREKYADFKTDGKTRGIGDAAEIYLVLITYKDDITQADVRKEFETKCAEMLAAAQNFRTGSDWDSALEIYKEMNEAGVGEFLAATGQADLEELINETKYEQAGSYFAQGKYDRAAVLYGELEDYKDSQEQYKESTYQQGLIELDRKAYLSAIKEFEKIPGYKDAGARALDAKYSYCEQSSEKPGNLAYTYIEELVDTGYEGAEELQEKIYRWHVTIATGMAYSFGSMQSASVKATLYGGPPDGSATVRFDFYDFTRGESDSWSDEKEYKSGDTAEVNYSEEDSSYSLFDRTYRVRVYVDDELAGTWEGQFDTDFL